MLSLLRGLFALAMAIAVFAGVSPPGSQDWRPAFGIALSVIGAGMLLIAFMSLIVNALETDAGAPGRGWREAAIGLLWCLAAGGLILVGLGRFRGGAWPRITYGIDCLIIAALGIGAWVWSRQTPGMNQ